MAAGKEGIALPARGARRRSRPMLGGPGRERPPQVRPEHPQDRQVPGRASATFFLSATGEKILFSQGRAVDDRRRRPGPVEPGKGALNTGAMEVRVEPLVEWRQMYREAWRIERDFFYDAGAPRPRPRGGGEEIRALPRGRRQPPGPQLPLRGDARRADLRPRLRRRRRSARGQEGRRRPARRRLQGRERPLPLRPRLRRRELEPAAAGAADPAGRQRRGRRIPAGRQRPRGHGGRGGLHARSRPPPASRP
ncbi:MAG: hypothetical protein MZU91_11495 [Desulfosudis oleivorans]|nr:hypothetical protein [Desulfosudis oleivorans]